MSSQAPAKRLQRLHAKIAQRCWAQHVARFWPLFCKMFRHVVCCWRKFENGQLFQATLVDVARCVLVWLGSGHNFVPGHARKCSHIYSNKQLLNEAEQDMKNSADQVGCYPQRPKAEVDSTLRVL